MALTNSQMIGSYRVILHDPDDDALDLCHHPLNTLSTVQEDDKASSESSIVTSTDEALVSEDGVITSEDDDVPDSEEDSVYSEDISVDDRYITPIKRPRYPTLQDVVGRETCNSVMTMSPVKRLQALQTLAASWPSGRDLTELQGIIDRMILNGIDDGKRLDHDW